MVVEPGRGHAAWTLIQGRKMVPGDSYAGAVAWHPVPTLCGITDDGHAYIMLTAQQCCTQFSTQRV
jgi:hypothetical protein